MKKRRRIGLQEFFEYVQRTSPELHTPDVPHAYGSGVFLGLWYLIVGVPIKDDDPPSSNDH